MDSGYRSAAYDDRSGEGMKRRVMVIFGDGLNEGSALENVRTWGSIAG